MHFLVFVIAVGKSAFLSARMEISLTRARMREWNPPERQQRKESKDSPLRSASEAEARKDEGAVEAGPAKEPPMREND
jgi:hypothetical protein